MKGNIPADWDGETWTDFCVPCPDSDGWRAALLGAIYTLTRGRRWSADSGTIVDAQAVGRAILQGMEEGCGMDANPITDVAQDGCEVVFTYLDETTETVNIRDCPPTLVRKNVITGVLVYWSGTAWIEVNVPAGEPVPDPDDPRFQGGDWETPTPGTGIDIVCRSADAMKAALQQAAGDLVDEIDWNNAAWESTFSIFNTGLSTIAGLFSGFATGNAALGLGIGIGLHAYLQSVAEEFLGLANLYDLQQAEDLADPLNANWADMRCLLYCNLNSDGQLNYAGHLSLLEDIDFLIDTLTDPSWYEFIRPIVEMAGTDALNAAYGTYGSTQDDCTACDCITLHQFFGGHGIDERISIVEGAYNATEDRVDGDCQQTGGNINDWIEVDIDNTIGFEIDLEWHATRSDSNGYDVLNAQVGWDGTTFEGWVTIDSGDQYAQQSSGARTVGAIFDTPQNAQLYIQHQTKSLTCQYYSRIVGLRVWSRD